LIFILIMLILSGVSDIDLPEKVLLAHFYSFGAKGCWQSNATLADMFMVSKDTISRWISRIKKYISVKCPKGYYRTIWVKSHPDAAAAHIEFKEADKNTPLHFGKNAELTTANLRFDYRKSAFPLRQKCRTTNNNTIKENYIITTAATAPLPAGGQAPSLLEQRKADLQAAKDELYRRFGRPKHSLPKRTPEELERMRREALEQMEKMIEQQRKKAV